MKLKNIFGDARSQGFSSHAIDLVSILITFNILPK